MLKIYLRQERPKDPVNAKEFQVTAYRDPEATESMGTWPSHYKSKPRKGCKTTTLNCTKWSVIWLPDGPGVKA